MFDLSAIPGLEDIGDSFDEVKGRMPEFVEPIKFFSVAIAWTGGDLLGHQLFDITKGDKTPENYYRNKLLWAPPALLIGRIISDFFGGPKIIRAVTLGTAANLIMQARYLFTQSKEFNLTVFFIHEILLVPLSMFITGEPKQD